MAYDSMKQFPFKDGYSFLEFNGVDIGAACEMFILGKGTYGAPSRDVDQIHVPGRNGDILIDNGGWNNITVKYPDCNILSNFGENVDKLRGYLLSNPGYHTLIDQYHPDEVRYAEFRGPFTADAHTGTGNDSGSFDLEFNCKPQRFLREWIDKRRYASCPYERKESTTNTADYAYFINTGKAEDSYIGNTYTWCFSNDATITISNGYFLNSYGYIDNAYDGETVFKNGVVSIPLIGKDGKQYYGFKGEFHSKKNDDFRMTSYKTGSDEPVYYYYEDGTDICLPLNNPTMFEAYPIIKVYYYPSGTDNTIFSCGGRQLSVNNSQLGYTTSTQVEFNINGLDATASTNKVNYNKMYSGISGDIPIIPANKPSVLRISNIKVSDVSLYFSPMYYKI